ncbi:uncharacterized protein BJ212DRAFT_1296737 [Suillus subaureus]|uniref:Uncharacterized protein n=1 Tax=Suillus subaureus TaxID=48587 RepID=A0A9P7EID6_9AGAM|nr:uncharacterized protein BJ212DRAFT_1296737 [Suillus subaureus]KAG1822772.1 hypothetical protein BJ212DRAFT_1296737 [Suillus subaureus]
MVEEFKKIKTSGWSKPLNITSCTHLTEVNSSFAAMVSEAEVLKEHVGMEMLIVTIQIEVTENTNATLEFVCYECMVQEHLVKLVGWCHTEWGNPSNLKGGVEWLEALAQAVSDRKCKFV